MVLVLGTTTEPGTLDPAFARLAGEQEILRLLFRDLTEFDETWRVRPSMAAALPTVHTSTRGPEVAWTLAPDLFWSDGTPLTSKDVAFGHLVESDPRLEAVSHRVASRVLAVVETSSSSFTVRWKSPYADYLAPRVHVILPSHAYPPRRPGFAGMRRAPVSNGPFKVEAWVHGRHLSLVPNPHWRKTKPALDRVVFRFFRSEDSFEAELATGGLDALGEAAGLSLDRAKDLERRLSSTHRVVYTDSGVWLQLHVRHDHPLLRDLRARRAIAKAVDRSQLATLLYAGEAAPAFGLFAPRHPAHLEGDAGLGFDLEAAKGLLEGVPEKHRALTLQFGSGSQAAERAAVYLKAQLARIGLRLTLEGLPLRALSARLEAKTHAPLVLLALRTRPDWDGRSLLASEGAQNHGGFTDAELDALLARAEREMDRARWAELVRQVGRRYRETLPTIPLLFRRQASVVPRWLEGWRPTGTTAPVTWNAEQWRRVTP